MDENAAAVCRNYRMPETLSSSHSLKSIMKFYDYTVCGWFLQQRSQVLQFFFFFLHNRNPIRSSDGDCKWKVNVKRDDI